MTHPVLDLILPGKGITIRTFLKQTLCELIHNDEGFRGKDWLYESEMPDALVAAGLVEVEYDKKVGELLKAAVAAM
jgi:hypothetical protein